MNWLLKLFKRKDKATIVSKHENIAPTCLITEYGLMPVMFAELGKRGIMFGLN